MTPGQLLRESLDAQALDQTAVAMEWLQRHNDENPKRPLSATTVPSRLSELLADKEKGVRFFFQDPRRAVLLRDVLKLDESTWQAVQEAADQLMSQGTPPARLVLDLSTWPDDTVIRDQSYDQALRFLEEARLWPAVLVLTEAQYDKLPRSFDKVGGPCRFERFEGDGAPAEVVRALVGPGALYVGQRPLAPIERWLALPLVMMEGEERLRVEPSDGLERFRRDGRLDGPPVIEHRLHDPPMETSPLADLDWIRNALAHAGLQFPRAHLSSLRCIHLALASPDAARSLGSIEVRQELAARLQVPAACSAEEVEEVERKRRATEIARLAGERSLPRSTEASLALVLQAASVMDTRDAWLYVGDTLHVVNPTRDPPAHPDLKVHHVEVSPSVLHQMLDELSGWTVDDAQEDPLLDALTSRLVEGGADLFQARLARITILSQDVVRPRGPRLETRWQGPLRALLAQPLPAARLRDCTFASGSEGLQGVKEYLANATVDPLGLDGLDALGGPMRPLFAPTIRRVQRVVRCHVQAVVVEAWEQDSLEQEADAIWKRGASAYRFPEYSSELRLPVARLDAEGVSGWSWVCATAVAGFILRELRVRSPWNHNWREVAARRAASWNEGVWVSDVTWRAADVVLGQAWLALRVATDAGRAVALHDGRVVLQVARGVVAVLSLRQWGAKDRPIDAILSWRPTQGDVALDGLPHGLQLRGLGWVVDIEFQRTPLANLDLPAGVLADDA